MTTEWIIKNNGFSNKLLKPESGEFRFLDDVYEMSLIATECVLSNTKMDKDGNFLNQCPKSFTLIDEWQQIAICGILNGSERQFIKPLNMEFDHKGNCALSGTLQDLEFAVPLFQAALYEWGLPKPLLLQCMDSKSGENMVIAIAVDRWVSLSAEKVLDLAEMMENQKDGEIIYPKQ